MRPIIGITGNLTYVHEEGFDPFEISYTPHAYTEVIQAVGGIPIVFPLTQGSHIEEQLELVDALLFTGGQDVNPFHYQEQPGLLLGGTSPLRDAREIELLHAALKMKKPVLGVCRGLQLINVALGGSLYQDLSEIPNLSIQHVQKTPPEYTAHAVNVKSDSALAQIMTSGDYVNTIHHQAIKTLGKGLEVSAWSPDNVIEAFESRDDDHSIVGVQWHPELTYKTNQPSRAIFENLVHRGLARRQGRSS